MKKVWVRRWLAVAAVAAVVFLSRGLFRTVVRLINQSKEYNTKCFYSNIADADATHFLLPQAKETKYVIFDHVEWTPDRHYRTYSEEDIEPYIDTLQQAGYQLQRFEKTYNTEYYEYDSDTDSEVKVHKEHTSHVVVAALDGKYIYISPYCGGCSVYLYETQAAPEGGVFPEEALEIIRTPEKCVDPARVRYVPEEYPASPVQEVLFNPVDVTPEGMFEKTGAQVFMVLTYEKDELPDQRYYIVRYGCAYEWNGRSSAAFLDVTGDGNTELCLIDYGGDRSTEEGWVMYECFSAFPKPGKDGLPKEYTLFAGDPDFELDKDDFHIIHPFSRFGDPDDPCVVGMDQKQYELTFSLGQLVLKGKDRWKTIRSNKDIDK